MGLGDGTWGFDFENTVKSLIMETFLFGFENKINTLGAVPQPPFFF